MYARIMCGTKAALDPAQNHSPRTSASLRSLHVQPSARSRRRLRGRCRQRRRAGTPLGAHHLFHALPDAASLLRSDAEVLRLTAPNTYESPISASRATAGQGQAAALAGRARDRAMSATSRRRPSSRRRAARDLIFMAAWRTRQVGMAFTSDTLSVLAAPPAGAGVVHRRPAAPAGRSASSATSIGRWR